MKYPTAEDIFLTFELNEETTEELTDMNRVLNKKLDCLIAEKKLSEDETERIRNMKSEIESESRITGFRQGFYFAVKLLFNL